MIKSSTTRISSKTSYYQNGDSYRYTSLDTEGGIIVVTIKFNLFETGFDLLPGCVICDILISDFSVSRSFSLREPNACTVHVFRQHSCFQFSTSFFTNLCIPDSFITSETIPLYQSQTQHPVQTVKQPHFHLHGHGGSYSSACICILSKLSQMNIQKLSKAGKPKQKGQSFSQSSIKVLLHFDPIMIAEN